MTTQNVAGTGAILRLVREDAGIRQGELARLAGVSQEQLSRVELGKVNPSRNFTGKITRAVGEYLIAASVAGQHLKAAG